MEMIYHVIISLTEKNRLHRDIPFGKSIYKTEGRNTSQVNDLLRYKLKKNKFRKYRALFSAKRKLDACTFETSRHNHYFIIISKSL